MASKDNNGFTPLIKLAVESADNAAYEAAVIAANLHTTNKAGKVVIPKPALAELALALDTGADFERAAVVAGHTQASFSGNAPEWQWFYDGLRSFADGKSYYDGMASDMVLVAIAQQYLGYGEQDVTDWLAERAVERSEGAKARLAVAREKAQAEKTELKNTVQSQADLIAQLKAQLEAAGVKS